MNERMLGGSVRCGESDECGGGVIVMEGIMMCGRGLRVLLIS